MISYNNFLSEDLKSEEGGLKLRMATKLKEVFRALANKQATKDIAESFLKNIRNPEISLPISFLNATEKSDTVSFLSKARVMQMIRDEDDKLGTYKTPLRQELKIGKLINRIFKDKFTPKQVETFINEFKGHMDMINGNVKLRLVDGADIAYWYSATRYAKTGKGTLNNSCMRNVSADQLAMYVDNPKVCRLAILVNSDGKLEARALVWVTNHGTVMDRVYYVDDHIHNAFITYAKKQGWLPKNEMGSRTFTIKLHSGKSYSRYPYLDTFRRYDARKGTLTNR